MSSRPLVASTPRGPVYRRIRKQLVFGSGKVSSPKKLSIEIIQIYVNSLCMSVILRNFKLIFLDCREPHSAH